MGAAGLLGAVLLVSCNGMTDEKPGAMGNDAAPPAPPVNVEEPVELVFYSNSGSYNKEEFMRVFGTPLMKKFPHVTPMYIEEGKDGKLRDLIATGQTIDIVFNSIGQTALSVLAYNMQYDISELIKKHKFDLNQLEPTSIEIQRQLADGGIYGLPYSTNSLATYYNKELFDKFGVPYPKDGMTWEDINDLTKRMSRADGDTQYRGLILSMDHTTMLDPLSPTFIEMKTNKPLFTTEKFKQSFQMLTGFYDIPGNEVNDKTKTYAAQLELFQTQKTSAMFLGLSALGGNHFADKFDLDWDVVSYPRYKEAPDIGPQSYPNYFYINRTSKHKDIAFRVIASFTEEDIQRSLARDGVFPILNNPDIMKEYGANLPFMKSKNIKGFLPDKFAVPAFQGEFQQFAKNNIREAFYSVTLGQKDVNTALRDLDEAVSKDIANAMATK